MEVKRFSRCRQHQQKGDVCCGFAENIRRNSNRYSQSDRFRYVDVIIPDSKLSDYYQMLTFVQEYFIDFIFILYICYNLFELYTIKSVG